MIIIVYSILLIYLIKNDVNLEDFNVIYTNVFNYIFKLYIKIPFKKGEELFIYNIEGFVHSDKLHIYISNIKS